MKNGKTLILMSGLVGSGKSFVANEMSSLLNCPSISKDEIRARLRRSKGDFKEATQVLETETREAFKSSNFVVVDSDAIGQKQRDDIESKAKKEGIRVIYVYVKSDTDVAIGRIISADNMGEFFEGAGTTWKGEGSLHGKIVKLREMWRRTPLHFDWAEEPMPAWKLKDHKFPNYTVDTTDNDSVASQVKEIVSQIKS